MLNLLSSESPKNETIIFSLNAFAPKLIVNVCWPEVDHGRVGVLIEKEVPDK